MFSKKTVLIVGVIFLIAVNIIILTAGSRSRTPASGLGRIAVSVVSPFQSVVTHSIRSFKGVWEHYFFLVSVAEENQLLKNELALASERDSMCREIELSNIRLRKLLKFQKAKSSPVLSAEVIAYDPSPWFKTVVIDKGEEDTVVKGMPVVVPDGIVGQIIEVSGHYSKVLLINDVNSAVDAMIQRTRARGVTKGKTATRCTFEYVLRNHDIVPGDPVVSSGLDGVYPKGMRLGQVSAVMKKNSGIFQEVEVAPYVDFEKLEEVLVILNTSFKQNEKE